VPADVTLAPGESATFKLRTFDQQGRFLKETKGSFSLAGALPPPPAPGAAPPPKTPSMSPPALQGQVDDSGKLMVSKTVPAQFGRVVAKADGLEAYARVRVAPTLPYAQDFEKVPDGRTPPAWINCQGKFVVETKDGSKVLKKLANNPNPILARAYTYIAMPNLTAYTIEAEVQGMQKGADLPDMGVVANRYTLMLDGNKQNVRICSWEALPRVDKTVSFEWKPNVWYRMKLTVDAKGAKALVRGKVWPRAQQEPDAWSIEFEDPVPNQEGSPALYGYATGILESGSGAEIFYDNIKITPNR
jgi:hypothetical protein